MGFAEESAKPATYSWLKPRETAAADARPESRRENVSGSFAEKEPKSLDKKLPSQEASRSRPKVSASVARYFFMDDGGIFAKFMEKEVESLCREAVDEREREIASELEAEKNAKEDALAEAQQARQFLLMVKYFRRWRVVAQKLWQLRIGQRNRELRQQMAEEKRAKLLRAKAAKQNVVADFSQSISSKKRRLDEEEKMLTDSGVLYGLRNPRLAAANIVRGNMGPPRSTTPLGSPAKPTSAFGNSTASLQSLVDDDHIPQGMKTQLRRKRSSLGLRQTSESANGSSFGHRRSLSANMGPDRPLNVSDASSRYLLMPKSYSALDNKSPKSSNVETDYFRLKARGIFTMPNGAPVASTVAVDLRSSGMLESARTSRSEESLRSTSNSERGLKRSVSSALSFSAKRVKSGPAASTTSNHTTDIEEIKARARRVMEENALSKQREEAELRRSYQPAKSEHQRELEMEEMFRRSRQIREAMAKDEEWMREHRTSMSRSVSRAAVDREQPKAQPMAQLAKAPPSAPAPSKATEKLFATPAKKTFKPPPKPQPKPQQAVEVIDLSD